MDIEHWGAGAIGASIVAVLTGIGLLIERYYKAKVSYDKVVASDRRREESSILREYKELADKQKEDIIQNREEIDDLRNQMNQLSNELAVCRIGRARADERIAALEEALQDANIPFRKWNPETSLIEGSGSGLHKPIESKLGAKQTKNTKPKLDNPSPSDGGAE